MSRIERAALSFMNSAGRAEFGQYELAEYLGHDLGRGERQLAEDSTVAEALSAAMVLGVLDAGSTGTCLIVPRAISPGSWMQHRRLLERRRGIPR